MVLRMQLSSSRILVETLGRKSGGSCHNLHSSIPDRCPLRRRGCSFPIDGLRGFEQSGRLEKRPTALPLRVHAIGRSGPSRLLADRSEG